MAISSVGDALTRAHRQAQQQIADLVEEILRKTWPLLDPRALDATAEAWSALVLPVVSDGHARSVRAAEDYLRAFVAAETGREAVIPALLAPPMKAAETSLRVTGPITIKALVGNGMATERAAETGLSLVIGSMKRHVLDGGRHTVEASVAADPNATGWRRVGDGDDCKFCRMLIGRGEVYSADTAKFASHDRCNCAAEPAYDSGERATVEQYAASKRRTNDTDRARVRAFLAQMD